MPPVPAWPARDTLGHGPSPGSRRAHRTGRCIALVVRLVAIGSLAAAMMVGVGPARANAGTARLTGYTWAVGDSSLSPNDLKDATAVCPAGKVVLGGGARVLGADNDPYDEVASLRKVTLAQMEPFYQGSTGHYAYRVTAAEVSGGTTADWRVNAVALCVDPVANYSIVHSPVTPATSGEVQAVSTPCPSGRRVLGTGARVIWPDAVQLPGVGLQVQRTDALGGLGRAQAHEQASGVSHEWQLMGFAVCGDAPQGYEIVTAPSYERASETVKTAYMFCDGQVKNLISAGGAVTDRAPGNVTLGEVVGFPGVGGARAYENAPTSDNWDYIVSRGICVDG